MSHMTIIHIRPYFLIVKEICQDTLHSIAGISAEAHSDELEDFLIWSIAHVMILNYGARVRDHRSDNSLFVSIYSAIGDKLERAFASAVPLNIMNRYAEEFVRILVTKNDLLVVDDDRIFS